MEIIDIQKKALVMDKDEIDKLKRTLEFTGESMILAKIHENNEILKFTKYMQAKLKEL